MKVTSILKGRTDQLGRMPVQIPINEGNARRFVATKIKVKPADWLNEFKQNIDLLSAELGKDLGA